MGCVGQRVADLLVQVHCCGVEWACVELTCLCCAGCVGLLDYSQSCCKRGAWCWTSAGKRCMRPQLTFGGVEIRTPSHHSQYGSPSREEECRAAHAALRAELMAGLTEWMQASSGECGSVLRALSASCTLLDYACWATGTRLGLNRSGDRTQLHQSP